jgi:hypothetical protein
MRLRGFVPLDDLVAAEAPAQSPTPFEPPAARPTPAQTPQPRDVPPRLLAEGVDDWERRVSLFGELEA